MNTDIPQNAILQAVPQGMIVDFVTKELRKDSPEEYIRQNFEKALHLEYGFDLEEMGVEFPVRLGSQKKRVDICIFKDAEEKTQESIRIIVETKKPSISANDKKNGIDQLKSYLSACVNAEFGIWTNGVDRVVYYRVLKNGLYKYEEIIDIPKKNESLYDVYEITKKKLKKATGDNLLFTFKRCHNYIAGHQGVDKEKAFWELLKIIFCKIQDERSRGISFCVLKGEDESLNGYLKVKKRIGIIFDEVKQKYKKIFEKNEQIDLHPPIVAYIVAQLQSYDLLNSQVDVKGTAYEQIVGSNLRGDRGEFFTPRNVVKMAVRMLNIKPDKKVLDPACGTGGFLIYVFNNMMEKIKDEEKKRWDSDEPTEAERFELYRKMEEYADDNIFGIDFNPKLVKASKMNMVMNNDGQGNLFALNSLENPHMWDEETNGKIELGTFDVVVTNPPFGSKIKIDDVRLLEQFELARIWEKEKNLWKKTERFKSGVAPEILFIERCVQFLKPNGRMAIVLPNGILSDPDLEHVRNWVLTNCEVLASVSLPVETFLPYTGTKTGVLFLRKKTKEEILTNRMPKTDLFFRLVKYVGKDRRGKIVYKLDEEGNEIIKKFNRRVERKDKDGKIEVITEEFDIKIVNDETHETGEFFLEPIITKKLQHKQYWFDYSLLYEDTLRFDATFYDNQYIKELSAFRKANFETALLGTIAREIYDPNLFTRIYVTKEHGIPYMSSSEMLMIDPPLNKRFISTYKTKEINQYVVKEGDILITAAGTTGNVMYAPKYMEGIAVTSDVTRVKIDDKRYAAFVSAFLSTEIGKALLTKNIYGSIVDRIRAHHVKEIPIPKLPNSVVNAVSDLIIEVNDLRNQALNKEIKAKELIEKHFKEK